MKKLLSLLLGLILCLCLCACENDSKPSDTTMQNPPSEPAAPIPETNPPPLTTAEQTLLYRYQQIHFRLKNYAKNGSILISDFQTGTTYYNQDALRYCYEQLMSMEAVDAILKRGSYGDGLMNRKALLARFKLVEDCKLRRTSKTTDNLGNVSEGSNAAWGYNSKGQLYRSSGNWGDFIDWGEVYGYNSIAYSVRFLYDINDVVYKTQFERSSGSIAAILTHTYNEQGQKVSETLKTNTRETVYTYTYNSEGKLSQIEWFSGNGNSNRDWITFTYEGDLLISKSHFEGYAGLEYPYLGTTTVYAYDENGHLSSSTTTVSHWDRYPEKFRSQSTKSYTYVCDDKGRVIQITHIPYKNATFQSRVETIHYGTYYVYTPAQ